MNPIQDISKDAIESAFCFFHQKQRIYQYSTLEWQKEDIEYAISEYTDSMSKELYCLLSRGNNNYLRVHNTFYEDIKDAVSQLETML